MNTQWNNLFYRRVNVSSIPLAIVPQRGFSLIALIGVLAVITIGLSLVTPAFVRMWDQRHQDTEDQQLRLIAEGIRTYLDQNKAFPPSLASLVPKYVPFSAAQVTTNARGFPRHYAIHPAMAGFNNSTGLSVAELVNVRFLLVSNLTQDAAPTITTAAEFEAWWTMDESLVPDLHIQRNNIGNVFYSLAITPEGNGAAAPATNSVGNVLPAHNAFHLVGTTIGFDEADTYSSPEVQFALTTNTRYWFDPNCTTDKQWNPISPNCLGPLVLYTFEEGSGTTVNDVSGMGSPLNLTVLNGAATSWVPGALSINSSTIVQSSVVATKVIDAITASNAITIEAWVKPANITQDGPARIVTLSQTTGQRNFTMGQGRWGSAPPDVYDLRLRTTATSNNGMPSITTPSGTATTTLTHVVYTRDASGSATIYVNAVSQASGAIGGNLSNWNTTFKLGLANEFTLDWPWLGELHLVAIYDTALSQSQVTQRYEEARPKKTVDTRKKSLNVVDSKLFQPLSH